MAPFDRRLGRRRWLLVAREGLLSHDGVGVRSTMDIALRKHPHSKAG